MELGWIDFSKSERNKVLSVLDLLGQRGTLDELGIAPVRDGFADLFFPGTSTIQTRAKYFFIVPYALKDLELSGETDPHQMLKELDAIEKQCALILKEKGENPIGIRTLGNDSWVKRAPSSIYWSGLRSYGIFTGPLSLAEYIWRICEWKKQKKTLAMLGNKNDRKDNKDKEQDDWDAGGLYQIQFWNIPTYQEKWQDYLDMHLTKAEGVFLKCQIIAAHPDSMMAYILKNRREDILNCGSFEKMSSLIHQFPEQIQKDYWMAKDFSEFLLILRILYNMIISSENKRANQLWIEKEPNLKQIAETNIEGIIQRLNLYRHTDLCIFLRNSQKIMANGDVEGLKETIKKREYFLKDVRAKTAYPGTIVANNLIGGELLDYRFSDASEIIRDIFESEAQHV